MLELLNKYVYSECQSPITINIYNGVKDKYIPTPVPCGKCFHCKITRINEWVTRMVTTALYNKYVYFGTLTYSGTKNDTVFHDETIPLWSNFNKYGKWNYSPTLLRKDHLQKFFKRLRKNTGIRFQYCACGEYGSEYGRPHYHYIIFSNTPILHKHIKFAWSAKNKDGKRKYIGRTSHIDIKNTPQENPDHAFKYVCKYIQKTDFKFNELPNYKQHEKVFNREFSHISTTSNERYYISKKLDKYLIDKDVKDMFTYEKVFSPFFISSKKPAIGYQYFKVHEREFKSANFKLFGISEDYIFPLYFIRKAKEAICPFKMQSTTSDSYLSYSRIPKVVSLLERIENAELVAENTDQIVQIFRHHDSVYTIQSVDNIHDLDEYNGDYHTQYIKEYTFEREYMSFYNCLDKCYYSFRGDYYALYKYNANTKLHEYKSYVNINYVKNLLNYYYHELSKAILVPLLEQSKISANKKSTVIKAYYDTKENFENAKKRCVEQFNRNIDYRQHKYKLTKNFE